MHYLINGHRKKVQRFSTVLLALVFLVSLVSASGVSTVLFPTQTYAKPESEMVLEERVRSYAYLNAVSWCIKTGIGNRAQFIDAINFGNWSDGYWKDRVSEQNAVSGNWWKSDYTAASSFLFSGVNESDGRASCNEILKDALVLWGYDNGLDFICDTGIVRANETSCDSGSGDFGNMSPYWERFRSAVIAKVYADETPSLNERLADGTTGYPGRYLLYYNAFIKGCDARKSSVNSGGEFFYSEITTVGTDGTTNTDNYEGVRKSDTRNIYVDRDNLSFISKSCQDISNDVDRYATDYAKYRKANSTEVFTPPSESYCIESSSDPSCINTATSCGVEGIGWIICPAISFMSDILNDAFKALADNFLRIEVALFSTDSGTFIGWSIFRNIANVAFVIVFLIIIFSQLTGVGVSNYGVKKLLPRVIITAILVNVSFFICQVAVDLSNILGYSLKSAFDSIAVSADVPTSSEASANGYGIAALTTAVIASAVVSYFALGVLIPVLLGAVVAILMVVLILIARQAIIILLIVLSPLAFVAYLLPNTESLFAKWRKMFITLLLVFPIVSIVFGAASLASQILSQATDAEGESAQAMQIIAVGVAALPFFAVPVLLKSSLDGIGSIGTKLNNFASRSGGALGKAGAKGYQGTRLGKFQQFRREKRQINRALTQSGAYTGRNKLRQRLSDFNKFVNTSTVGGEFGDRLAAQGVVLARETEEKSAKEQATLLRSQIASGSMTNEKLDEELAKAFATGDRVKTKAIQDIMFEQGGGGMNRFTEAVRKAQTTGKLSLDAYEALRENINTKHGQLVKTKSIALSKMAGIGGSLIEHADDISTWALSASDMAGQTGAQLQYAADRQLINPVTAHAMMSDARIRERLDPDQQAALSKAMKQTEGEYISRVAQTEKAKNKKAQDEAYGTYVQAGNIVEDIKKSSSSNPDKPYTSLNDSQKNPVNPADIGVVTGQSNTETIDIPLDDNDKK